MKYIYQDAFAVDLEYVVGIEGDIKSRPAFVAKYNGKVYPAMHRVDAIRFTYASGTVTTIPLTRFSAEQSHKLLARVIELWGGDD